MSPENPQDDTDKEDKALKRIAIDNVTWADLSIADPESESVAKFMAEHGLQFGDNVALDVEGLEQPIVVGTSSHDFFTRNRTLSEALSQGLISVEAGVTPPEGLAEKEAVDREMADKDFTLVGLEEPVPDEDGQTGEVVEDPEQKKQELGERVHGAIREYERQVLAILDEINGVAVGVDRISDELQEAKGIATGALNSLQDHAQELRRLTGISFDDHNVSGMRTLLNGFIEDIRPLKARFAGPAETVGSLRVKEAKFQESLAGSGDQLGEKQADFEAELQSLEAHYGQELPEEARHYTTVDGAKGEVNRIKEGLATYLGQPAQTEEELKALAAQVENAIVRIEEIITSSYRTDTIDSDELQVLAETLRKASEYTGKVPRMIHDENAKDELYRHFRLVHNGAE